MQEDQHFTQLIHLVIMNQEKKTYLQIESMSTQGP